jgi:predicted RNase H-like HicB family nuclease
MSSKVSIVVERNESGYLISFPESENQQFQDQSFEAIIAKLKETLSQELSSSTINLQPTTGQSLLRLAQRFAADMSEDEINQLPADAAQNHDHYLYRTGES